jgi:hypothetical protein
MAVKGDDHGQSAVLPGVRDGLANDLLMAEMDSIENPDGGADLALAGPQFGSTGDNAHQITGRKQLIGRRGDSLNPRLAP